MYSNLPNLVIRFHGCDKNTYHNVWYKHHRLMQSKNPYDWLGNGIYFWENSLERAKDWAEYLCKRYNTKHSDQKPKEPAVIGAVISLGYCLNLTDYGSNDILQMGYEILKFEFSKLNQPLPVNKNVKGNQDLLLRDLDCAVIERIHQYNKECNKRSYDSVRGIFLEGDPVYKNSGIMEKTYVQLCIRNPNCIKGYFKPLVPDTNWSII